MAELTEAQTTLHEMFDEWFTSLPVERRPERDSPAFDLLIDAWIAGFAKHNEITCAAQRPRSRKQRIEIVKLPKVRKERKEQR